ncbi:hypothetical protein ECG_03889 [Echinococcus granulosus]|nr:hypothetical protein ECG_03889 [Echinococcus granulosus]
MVYSKPHYFLGQQDAGLPLKGRSQSVLDLRPYSGAFPRIHVHSPSPHEKHYLQEYTNGRARAPSPLKPAPKTSAFKSGQTKPIWIDRKTGRVVKGPEILKGERLIRFEDSTTTDSQSTETVHRLRPMPRVNIGGRSPRHSPRRTSRSAARHYSSSPSRRDTSPYRRTSPTRNDYYRYGSYARFNSPRRYSPRCLCPCSLACTGNPGFDTSSSSSSTSSYTASLPSSSYFQTEVSESETSTSSGYNSGAFDWRNYHGARYLGQSPSRTNKIIMLKPRSGRSPLQSLVPHLHHCGQRQSKCTHKACQQRCEHCKPPEFRRSVSRRSRATSKILPPRPSSNLSFFEETILPGPSMPLHPVTPLRYDESETYSDSSSSYYVPTRNYMRNASQVRGRARTHGRLNGNLEKWLNDAVKSSYSPAAINNFKQM